MAAAPACGREACCETPDPLDTIGRYAKQVAQLNAEDAVDNDFKSNRHFLKGKIAFGTGGIFSAMRIDHRRNPLDVIGSYLSVFRTIENLASKSDDRTVHILKRSILKTINEIDEKLSEPNVDAAELRKILTGLKQGLRDVPKFIFWMSEADAAHVLAMIEDVRKQDQN